MSEPQEPVEKIIVDHYMPVDDDDLRDAGYLLPVLAEMRRQGMAALFARTELAHIFAHTTLADMTIADIQKP